MTEAQGVHFPWRDGPISRRFEAMISVSLSDMNTPRNTRSPRKRGQSFPEIFVYSVDFVFLLPP